MLLEIVRQRSGITFVADRNSGSCLVAFRDSKDFARLVGKDPDHFMHAQPACHGLDHQIAGSQMRLSHDLLTRGITYKLQERAYGGFSLATARKLERASADPFERGAAKPPPPISLRPGTRLVREWRGVTHTVLIQADGIEWHGQRYRSLSLVARKITSARWSGPRFFGLRSRQLDSYSSARAGHDED